MLPIARVLEEHDDGYVVSMNKQSFEEYIDSLEEWFNQVTEDELKKVIKETGSKQIKKIVFE